MLETIWQILDSVAAGGVLWLSVVLLLAILGEMGLPFTCPILESLLIFTGFQLFHGTLFVATLPFIATAYVGRLLGSVSLYHISGAVGPTVLDRYGPRIRVTPERVAMLKGRLSSVLIPTIIAARFSPGFTVLTSFVCGATRINKRQFLRAVLGQLVAWESAFILVGVLGAVASRSLDPSTQPLTLIIIIAISLSIGALGGYIIFNRLRNTRDTGSIPLWAVTTPAPSEAGQTEAFVPVSHPSSLRQTDQP